jgi:hypothetical protein
LHGTSEQLRRRDWCARRAYAAKNVWEVAPVPRPGRDVRSGPAGASNMLWRPAPATAFMGDEICSGIRRVARQFIVRARTYMTIYTLSHARRRLPCQHDLISRPQCIISDRSSRSSQFRRSSPCACDAWFGSPCTLALCGRGSASALSIYLSPFSMQATRVTRPAESRGAELALSVL